MGYGFARFTIAMLSLSGCTQTQPTAGTIQNVVFTETTPLTGNTELLRRSLSQPEFAHVRQALAHSNDHLAAQAIQPAAERSQLFVAALMPQAGYGLLVFVSPANAAQVPRQWTRVLNHDGILCVAPIGGGNDKNVIGRREPLALMAEQNVVRRFRIDPGRIWVTGFSGGSRVAMRLALGYPDVFAGAILNAGSDTIGDGGIPLPPDDLAFRFRSHSRLVYVTGEWDSERQDKDTASLQSMATQCVRHTSSIIMQHTGHELMDAASLEHALNILEAAPGRRSARCG
jgi:hypothetical protein